MTIKFGDITDNYRELVESSEVVLRKRLCCDRALYCLIDATTKVKNHEINFEDLTWNHSMFRKCDVSGNGAVDMAFWNLISGAELFWSLIEAYRTNQKYIVDWAFDDRFGD